MDRTVETRPPRARDGGEDPVDELDRNVDETDDAAMEADLEDDAYWHRYTRELVDTSFLTVLKRLPTLLRMAFGLAWRASRLETTATLVLQTAAGLLTALGLLATRGVLEQLFAAGPTPDRIRAAVPALAWVAVATASRAALSQAAGLAQARLQPRVRTAAEVTLVEVTSRVELAAFDDDSYAEDVARARNRGLLSLGALVDRAIDLVTAAVRFAAVGAALLVIHPALLPVLIVAALPEGWAAVRAARAGYLGQVQWLARMRRSWTFGHLLANRRHAPEMRAYDLAGYLLARYRRLLDAIVGTDLTVARQQTTARAIGAVLAGVGTAGVYVLLGVLLTTGHLALAAAGTAVLALQTGSGAFNNLIFAVNGLYENGLYASDYADVVRRTAERAEPSGDVEVPAPKEIRLEHVTLTYPGADKPALAGVSLTITAGQTIALVGPNGGGKSSLAKILGATYRPDGGTVSWDGVDTAGHAPAHLRARIAVITQSFAEWPFTAGENIRIGAHERPTTRRALQTAARNAGAHDMIAELTNGYDTLLDKDFKGGHELSQGQQQRLAAARGFYRDAPVLICDEPSAALDPRAEHVLFQHLAGRGGEQITILITHRLANVRHADQIFVIDHGTVLESGNHHDLMTRTDGTYRSLFELQAAGYLPERPAA